MAVMITRVKLSSLLLLLLLSCIVLITVSAEEDLYKLLGISKSATTKEIKSAYRKKALATHPDKNKDVPPEQAAEAFHKVVNAFEILTDDSSRKHYDRTGRAQQNQHSNGGGGGGNQWQFKTRFTWNNYGGHHRRQPLKDKFEVKEAMSRVMHIVSLEQLRTIILDDDDRLERNLLMIFVTPQQVEKIADEELCFPYPFAAMSTQGIWWEDVMQTVKIRYHRESDLTKFFGAPHGEELTKSGSPLILFAKRGQKLAPENFVRLQTTDRATFEMWTWKRISVDIDFVNNHDHPIEVFWIHDRSAKLSMTIQPGHRETHTTMLSHEWWVRDARVDSRPDSPRRTKLSKESLLGIWKIVSDGDGQEVVVESKECCDMSGHCAWWNQRHGECQNNPVFMKEQCSKSCKFCTDNDDESKTTRDKNHQHHQQSTEKLSKPEESAINKDDQPKDDAKDEL